MALPFGLTKADCEKIGSQIGGSLALKALVDNQTVLLNLNFEGTRFDRASWFKILGNKGAAQAVKSLVDHAEAFAKQDKTAIMRVAGKKGWPKCATRRQSFWL